MLSTKERNPQESEKDREENESQKSICSNWQRPNDQATHWGAQIAEGNNSSLIYLTKGIYY